MPTYDNTAAIKSFTDATANALAKYSYATTIAKVGDPVTETGLYAALKSSGKTDAEKAKIKNDIDVLHDLVMLYLDTESVSHKYVTAYTMSASVGYLKTLTDYKDGTYQFPQNVYFSVLTTGGLFKATSVNKVFTTCPAGTSCTTASNCTPICNFPNSNTDTPKPSLAFLENFDVIYKAISDEITPPATNPCDSCLTNPGTSPCTDKCPAEVKSFILATSNALTITSLPKVTTDVVALNESLINSNDPSNSDMKIQINLFHDFAFLHLDTTNNPPTYTSDAFKSLGNVSYLNTVMTYGVSSATDLLPSSIYHDSLKTVLDSLPQTSVFKNCNDPAISCTNIPLKDCTGICHFKMDSPPPQLIYMDYYGSIFIALKKQISKLPAPTPPSQTFKLPNTLSIFDLTKTKIDTFYFNLSKTKVTTLMLPSATLTTLKIPDSTYLPASLEITLDFCNGSFSSLANVTLPSNTNNRYFYKAINLSSSIKIELSQKKWEHKACS